MADITSAEVIELAKAVGFSPVVGSDLLLRDGEDLVCVCKLVDLVRLAISSVQKD